MNDFFYIVPEIFLLISSLFLLLVDKKKTLLVFLSVIISLIITLSQKYFHSEIIFSNFIAISPFTQTLKVIILALVAITLFMMMNNSYEYTNDLPILVAFSSLGMMSVVSSYDLLSMYMAIELQSLPMYVMTAIDRKSLQSSEAGVKYFILGALASAILLYGISILYGFTGSTNFADLTQIFRSGNLEIGVLFGSILIISALTFKVGAAPFHMWVPDVYQGSPTIITAFFAVVPKVALVGLFIRLFNYELVHLKLQQVFVLIAMLSLIVSALGALKQTNIKRLLAYSSIGHIGYILIGIAAAIKSQYYVTTAITYMVVYSLMNIGIFSIILRISNYNMEEWRGINKNHPIIAISLVVLLFSMAGIPPTAGFFTKMYILSSVVDSGLWWLALFALFTSVISAYYYLRIIKVIYFDSVQESSSIIHISRNTALSMITIVMAVINITFFLYSSYSLRLLFDLVNYL